MIPFSSLIIDSELHLKIKSHSFIFSFINHFNQALCVMGAWADP